MADMACVLTGRADTYAIKKEEAGGCGLELLPGLLKKTVIGSTHPSPSEPGSSGGVSCVNMMNKEDKLKALNTAIEQIEKAYGKGSVMKLREPGRNIGIESSFF